MARNGTPCTLLDFAKAVRLCGSHINIMRVTLQPSGTIKRKWPGTTWRGSGRDARWIPGTRNAYCVRFRWPCTDNYNLASSSEKGGNSTSALTPCENIILTRCVTARPFKISWTNVLVRACSMQGARVWDVIRINVMRLSPAANHLSTFECAPLIKNDRSISWRRKSVLLRICHRLMPPLFQNSYDFRIKQF